MNRAFTLALFFSTALLISFSAGAQKYTNEDNAKTAGLFKEKYPESNAIILENEVWVNFELKEDVVNVEEISDSKIMSLRINNLVNRAINYDINSKISGDCVITEKGKNLHVVPVCGNYESAGIFHSDHMLCIYPLSFNKLGEIFTFSYKLKKEDIRYYTSVFFQSGLPAVNSKITFTVPKWLDLELKEMNFEGYSIQKSVKESPKGTTYEYTATDLEEFKTEPNSFGISHTYPHLLLVAKSYKNGTQNTVRIISNTNDLHSWYGQLVLQLENNTALLKPLVEKIVAGSSGDLEKIKAIFYWVQDNIRYIAFENGIAGYKPAEASDVLRLKYGDCKGMANLTKWMLKTAGYDARLVWIGTEGIPYNYTTPSLAINNHMICRVNLNEHHYYLDATEKYLGFNDYAERIQGRTAMVEDGKSYLLDTIPVFNKDRNLNTNQFDLSISGQTLTGKCIQNYQGESHQDILYFLNNLEREKQKDFKEILISKEDKNMSVNNITSSDITDKEQAYRLEGDLVISNKISVFDNDYYIDVDFYKDFNNQKIKETRKSDIAFNEKKFSKMTVHLEVPQGYVIKYLPVALEIKEKQFSFTVSYKVDKNQLTYERIITIDNGFISKSGFETWNKAIKALSEKYNDKVILTKN